MRNIEGLEPCLKLGQSFKPNTFMVYIPFPGIWGSDGITIRIG